MIMMIMLTDTILVATLVAMMVMSIITMSSIVSIITRFC